MLYFKSTFATDDAYWVCDECGLIAPGRPVKAANQIKMPIGWVTPQRPSPQGPGTQEVFCGPQCLMQHDGRPTKHLENIPEPEPDRDPEPEAPDIALARDIRELPAPPESGQYGRRAVLR